MAKNATEPKEEAGAENLWNKILNEASRSVSVNKTQPNIVILGINQTKWDRLKLFTVY